MRTLTLSLVLVGLLSISTSSVVTAQRATAPAPAATPAATTASTDAALKALRDDLNATRADIMAKNLTLTAEQAAKFWPAYAKFQAEQTVIVDQQLAAIKRYAENYATLNDETATALVEAHLTRDLQMNQLRTRWLKEFQQILPGSLAARVIQIDRRLGLASQISISAQIPLVH
jgi:hypothetical protein